MELTFKGQLLTPLIIGGAEGKDSDLVREGLRPSAVKAGMCWWFRAMLGGLVSDHTIVRAQEKRFFGSQDGACPFRMVSRLRDPEWVQVEDVYLCMGDGTENTRYEKIKRPALLPPAEGQQRDTDVSIDLHSLLCSAAAVELNFDFDRCAASGIRAAIGSLWLATMLGGFGARSRRGFGSLAVSTDDDTTSAVLERLGLSFASGDESPANWFCQSLRSIRKDLAELPGLSRGTPALPLFPVLSPQYARTYLIWPQEGQWTDWQSAMVGLREHVYRPFKRPLNPKAIGLPRAHDSDQGLSSPLVVQVKRTRPKSFIGVLVAFRYQYAGEEGKKARGTAPGRYFDQPSRPGQDFARLDGFVEGLKKNRRPGEPAYRVERIDLG